MIESVLKEIENSLYLTDDAHLPIHIRKLLTFIEEERASKEIAELLVKTYNSYTPRSKAIAMEIMISAYPNLAMINFPENSFFRAAILTGSIELYNSYIKVALEPYFVGKRKERIVEYYTALYSIAEKLDRDASTEYEQFIPIRDFYGAVSEHKSKKDILLINRENYKKLTDVVDKYNGIIGRRHILEDLKKRTEL